MLFSFLVEAEFFGNLENYCLELFWFFMLVLTALLIYLTCKIRKNVLLIPDVVATMLICVFLADIVIYFLTINKMGNFAKNVTGAIILMTSGQLFVFGIIMLVISYIRRHKIKK